MKNIFRLLFKPHERWQEKTLLLIGVISVIIGCLLADFAKISYDGILDIHFNKKMTFITSLKENIINIGCVFALLFAFGKMMNKKTRWIDILNTSVIYRIPLFLAVPVVKTPVFEKMQNIVVKNPDHFTHFPLSIIDSFQLMVASVLLLLLITYSIVLLINGFKTATNIKKWQHFVIFALLLIVAEIISKILIINI